MPDQPPTDLDAALRPIVAALLPGWTVTAEWAPQDALDALIPGALAICDPVPTRSAAHVMVVSPWPARESLAETLWHELTHALLSPLTALIPKSDGAVMIEEQAVERLGVLLSKLPLAARAAVVRGVERWAPRLRARISASAGQRARGGQMDPELIQKMIDAIKGGDGEAALKMLEEALVKAGSGGAAPPTEPDADDMAAKDPAPPAKPGDGAPAGNPPPMDNARVVARKGVNVETKEQERARLQREEDEAITAFRRGTAKDELITRLRARLPGHDGLPAIERRILAASTFQTAKDIADVAIEMGGNGSAQRARSGVEHRESPDNAAGPAPFTVDSLVAEGLPRKLAQEAVEQWKIPGVGRRLAEQTVSVAKARLRGHDSEYMPTEPTGPSTSANGAARR